MTAIVTDRPLAARLAADEAGAVEELHRRFRRTVRAIVRDLVDDPMLVDDAIQETFVKVWRSRDRIDAARPLDPWVYQIARNAARDVRRAARRRRATTLAGGSDRLPERADDDRHVDPGRHSERRELCEQLDAAWPGLTADQVKVLQLQHLHDWSDREIAEALGLPIGTVKSRGRRGRDRLREMLSR